MTRKTPFDIKLKVGLRIKTLRNKHQFSQESLALKAGLDRTYINSVENGRRNISILNIAKIAATLQTSISDFFSDDLFKGLENEYEKDHS